MKAIFAKIIYTSMQHVAPFAMIRMPNEEAYQYFQTSQTIEKQGASLHVQPFNPALNKFSFESTSSKIETMIGSMSFSPCHLKKTDRRDYTENIQNAQLEFTQSSLHKVIISKIKIIDKPANFNLINYFQRLSKAYPQAAISLFTFEHCAWIAASPELLLKRNLNQIETVSLTGTKQKKVQTALIQRNLKSRTL
ncbi:MAG: chorismate-binding protein [Bacteroidetes bacterium]|nr:chorismate-binding protein [Bacteroidota bacterium]